MGRRKRGWNAAAGLSLADLKRLVDERMAQVDKLAERRAELAAELDEVDAELAAAGADGAVTTRRRGPGRPPKAGRRGGRPAKANAKKVRRAKGKRRGRKAGPKGQSTLHNAIRAALNGSSEPMKLADIAEKVKAGGYKTGSKHFSVIVGNRLAEMKDVKKAERGMYAMK